jgi:integrase/recombinase XerD
MKKLKIKEQNFLTLDEGCSRYLDNCRARNLREGTINHYRQSYVQFAKFFDMKMPVSEIDEKLYQKYVVFLRETLNNDISINSYLRDFIISTVRLGILVPTNFSVANFIDFCYNNC